MTKDQWRKALSMAHECGGEIVANDENIKTRKGMFAASLSSDTKENICHYAGQEWDEFTDSEKDSLLAVYCLGWNSEIDSRTF